MDARFFSPRILQMENKISLTYSLNFFMFFPLVGFILLRSLCNDDMAFRPLQTTECQVLPSVLTYNSSAAGNLEKFLASAQTDRQTDR